MRPSTKQRALRLTLFLVAAIPRILGAFLLPNAFGDAYVYIRDIGAMSTKMRAGTFAITSVYGFWLPLYQFIGALVNVFVDNGFYSGKLVSAVFGVGVCLLVYSVTLKLTAHRTAALLAFLVIALNPLHIFYSASAMTDVPHAFFVLGSVYFCLKERWVLAAVFAALAGLTRMESWMFIALIPAIQFFRQRRISFAAVAILAIPPLFWFYISWKATGDWLACFVARREYHDWLFAANPTLAHFSFSRALRDGATLLVSADIAVLIAAFVAGWFVIKPLVRRAGIQEDVRAIVPALIFFFAFLGLIVVAYLTGWQPIIFPRYGLILFTLGIPILAWTFLTLRNRKPQLARRFLISVIAIFAFDASVQLVSSVGLLNQISAQRAVADYLHTHFQPNSDARIFCDEGTVQALSGISPETFLTSFDAPRDREGFLNYLKERNVEYLVFVSNQDSTPVRLFPDLEYGDNVGPFEPVMNSHTEFLYTSIWLYRVRYTN
ncbi:MAG TPA: phospholipid carrier-dependent glycosyltransferase [Pyrinomonadaceae bacterium]|nr:phospholipid carrier-dependent glycosyltransferase [Pyrinomonadaceae bacterium]